MAWEDRTQAQKDEATRASAAYRARDDNKTYEVTTGKGTRITVTGRNSAKAVAGKDGSYREKKK